MKRLTEHPDALPLERGAAASHGRRQRDKGRHAQRG